MSESINGGRGNYEGSKNERRPVHSSSSGGRRPARSLSNGICKSPHAPSVHGRRTVHSSDSGSKSKGGRVGAGAKKAVHPLIDLPEEAGVGSENLKQMQMQIQINEMQINEMRRCNITDLNELPQVDLGRRPPHKSPINDNLGKK